MFDRSMLRTPVILVFALLGALASSCTILFDTEDARRRPPPLTAPEIHIEPASPKTLDDLTVVLDVPSEDPQGGVVEHAITWLRNGTPIGEGASIPHTETTKGDRFTVRVTGVLAYRSSDVVETSVDILNTPPVLPHVGLDRYDPFLDEPISAFVGHGADADGDLVQARFRWYLDDVPLSASSATIAVGSILGAHSGGRIRVEVFPYDDEVEGEPVDAGPAVIRPQGTQWRPLAPRRGGGCLIADPVHRRILRIDADVERTTNGGHHPAVHLWEYALERRTWIHLAPTGDPPLAVPDRCVVAEGGARAVLMLPYNVDLHSFNPEWEAPIVLEFAERGRERFRAIPTPSSDVNAGSRIGSAVAIDEARDRLLVFGGRWSNTTTFEETFYDDLWALDIGSGGAGWTRLLEHAPAGRLIAATMFVDPRTDQAFLVGGARFENAEGGTPSQVGDVWSIALDDGAFSPTPRAQMPESIAGAGIVPLGGADGEVLIGYGYGKVEFWNDYEYQATVPRTRTYRFRPSDAALTEIALTGDTAQKAWGMVGFVDPDAGLVLGTPAASGFAFQPETSPANWDDRFALRIADLSTGVTVAESAPYTHFPPGDGAITWCDAIGFSSLYGTSGLDGPEPYPYLKRFDFALNRWEDVAIPDPAPSPRFRSAFSPDTYYLAGGGSVNELGQSVSLRDVWYRHPDWNIWAPMHDGSGLPTSGFPSSFSGAAFWMSSCSGLRLFQGGPGASMPLWELPCDGWGMNWTCSDWHQTDTITGTDLNYGGIAVVQSTVDHLLFPSNGVRMTGCPATKAGYTTGVAGVIRSFSTGSGQYVFGGGRSSTPTEIPIRRFDDGVLTALDVIPYGPGPFDINPRSSWESASIALDPSRTRLIVHLASGALWQLRFD